MNRREFVALAAAAPFALRAALAAAGLSALVTCDAESRLAVVDLGPFRVVRSIADAADPRSIELVGRARSSATPRSARVSIVDRARRAARPARLRGAALRRCAPGRRHAFVTDSGRSGVVAVDVVRGRVSGAFGCRVGRDT